MLNYTVFTATELSAGNELPPAVSHSILCIAGLS